IESTPGTMEDFADIPPASEHPPASAEKTQEIAATLAALAPAPEPPPAPPPASEKTAVWPALTEIAPAPPVLFEKIEILEPDPGVGAVIVDDEDESRLDPLAAAMPAPALAPPAPEPTPVSAPVSAAPEPAPVVPDAPPSAREEPAPVAPAAAVE